MYHELKHILDIMPRKDSGVRGLTDRFCNHIEEESSNIVES